MKFRDLGADRMRVDCRSHPPRALGPSKGVTASPTPGHIESVEAQCCLQLAAEEQEGKGVRTVEQNKTGGVF